MAAAVLPCKRLVLIALVMLCFFSNAARAARSLRAVASNEISQMSHDQDPFSPKEDRVLADSDDLVTVDYTPARRKPPIHN
ncbi:hypothetical protein CJ030_MR6G024140 [Morella rubra]|uniref:Root meristem growth factor 9 n=1 Tax=Morella rubra TaxID=262757 RepID=A0A6A1VC82_9ROSI|nr:hypothetical protein CJ030_MR6G024140 [Morella rubra]